MHSPLAGVGHNAVISHKGILSLLRHDMMVMISEEKRLCAAERHLGAYSWFDALSGMSARMPWAAVTPGLLRVERTAAIDRHAAQKISRRLPLHLGRCSRCILCAVKRLHVCSASSALWKPSYVIMDMLQ